LVEKESNEMKDDEPKKQNMLEILHDEDEFFTREIDDDDDASVFLTNAK